MGRDHQDGKSKDRGKESIHSNFLQDVKTEVENSGGKHDYSFLKKPSQLDIKMKSASEPLFCGLFRTNSAK